MKNSDTYPDFLADQGSLTYAMLKAQYLLTGHHKIVAVHPQIRTLMNLPKGPGLWTIALSGVCYSVNADCKCNCMWKEQKHV